MYQQRGALMCKKAHKKDLEKMLNTDHEWDLN